LTSTKVGTVALAASWKILFFPLLADSPHQDTAKKKKKKRDDTPKKETTDEQTDMQSWDRKRQKIENLQMANLLSKKPKNRQMSRQTVSRFANAVTRTL
jgi:hypothetical protein